MHRAPGIDYQKSWTDATLLLQIYAFNTLSILPLWKTWRTNGGWFPVNLSGMSSTCARSCSPSAGTPPCTSLSPRCARGSAGLHDQDAGQTLDEHVSGKDADAAVDATVFKGKGKVAVVFKIRNLMSEQTWSMQRVRLVTLNSGRDRKVAVRATVREVTPGGAGVLAVVADGSAFVDDGVLTSLWLEVYRHDGLRQAFVQLDPTLIAR